MIPQCMMNTCGNISVFMTSDTDYDPTVYDDNVSESDTQYDAIAN